MPKILSSVLLGIFKSMFPISMEVGHSSNKSLHSLSKQTQKLDSLYSKCKEKNLQFIIIFSQSWYQAYLASVEFNTR